MATLTHTTHNQKFAQQEEEVSNFVQDGHPVGEIEGISVNVGSEPGRGGMVSGMLVEKGVRRGLGQGERLGTEVCVSPNLMIFLISRKKAFLAEVQKLVP